MGCGCGGAKRQVPQQQQAPRQDGGSTRTAPTQRTDFNDPGYTWTGPKRAPQTAR